MFLFLFILLHIHSFSFCSQTQELAIKQDAFLKAIKKNEFQVVHLHPFIIELLEYGNVGKEYYRVPFKKIISLIKQKNKRAEAWKIIEPWVGLYEFLFDSLARKLQSFKYSPKKIKNDFIY